MNEVKFEVISSGVEDGVLFLHGTTGEAGDKEKVVAHKLTLALVHIKIARQYTRFVDLTLEHDLVQTLDFGSEAEAQQFNSVLVAGFRDYYTAEPIELPYVEGDDDGA